MKNLNEFYGEIKKLSYTCEPTPLKRFLIGLYGQVADNREQDASFGLFHQMIKAAFQSLSDDFDKDWLMICDPPDITDMSGADYTLQVIRFQIAELDKMDADELGLEEEMFGIESEDGHTWYNFDPFTNLESGIQGLLDANHEGKLTWETLGEILEIGRVYE